MYAKALSRLPADMQEARVVRAAAPRRAGLGPVSLTVGARRSQCCSQGLRFGLVPAGPAPVAARAHRADTRPRLPTARAPQRRIRRAIDLSSKHVEIPKAMQEDPWREYKQVAEVFSETQKEVDERKAMSNKWWMPYHLGRETWHAYDTKSAWFFPGNKGAKQLK